MGKAGVPILVGIGHLQKAVFRILAMIMWLAPVGASGAMAAVVDATGWDALKGLLTVMIGCYITCILVVLLVLGTILKVVTGVNVLVVVQVPRP